MNLSEAVIFWYLFLACMGSLITARMFGSIRGLRDMFIAAAGLCMIMALLIRSLQVFRLVWHY